MFPVSSSGFYLIAENFRGRKLSRFGTKREFCGENFRGLQLLCRCGPHACATHPHTRNMRIADLTEKTFADGSETAKNAKVFRYTIFHLLALSVCSTRQ